MKTMWVVGLVLGITLTLALFGQRPALMLSSTATSATRAQISEVAPIRDNWVRHWNGGNVAAIVQSYAPDAVLLPANGQRITGRDAIARYFQHLMDSGASALSVESMACDAAGSLAYDSGRLRYTIRAERNQPNQIVPNAPDVPQERTVNGNYLVVLRREKGGRWLIVQHAFTEAIMKSLLEDKRPLVKPYPVPQ